MKVDITRSGMIRSLDYDEEKKELVVEFNSGSYCYFDVPKEKFDGCLGAESAGKHFLAHIKNAHKYEKCDD